MATILQANEDAIAEAAAVIRDGGLVAFPTETVYGLGANALDAEAVARIFAAKGRPAGNPLIVHVGRPEDLPTLAEDFDKAKPLIDRFWPGPLTVVLKKKPIVPDIVTAGGPTVAVRMPAHPVALALIREAGVPIAAPSANRSEGISPTQAGHVAEDLGDEVDMILDGGHSEVGLESTVIDLTQEPARVLRPGMVLAREIEAVLGAPLTRPTGAPVGEVLRSPGQMRRHYAPRTRLQIMTNPAEDMMTIKDHPIGMVAFGSLAGVPLGVDIATTMVMPAEPAAYAARLYDALHVLDEADLALIVVEDVPEGEEWAAIRDRLSRAASSPA